MSVKMDMTQIFEELNLDNGANYKMDVLKKHADNALLKRVIKMALDNVTYNFHIRKIPDYKTRQKPTITLATAIDSLEAEFCTRKVTGNKSIERLRDILSELSKNDAEILKRIVERDLKLGIGKTTVNKVWKNLIVKPVYMRCGVFGEKTAAKINVVGAYCQLKADGTYREATVDNEMVTFSSRSGENYDYPLLDKILCKLPDGKYIGELTVVVDGVTMQRNKGNGLLKSDDPPHENIVFDVWDYVTLEEYDNALNKIKNTTPYKERFLRLTEILTDVDGRVRLIKSHIVNDLSAALKLTSAWMDQGLEGSILKDQNAVFRDGTNLQQLKLKLEIDADVRITGFTEGFGRFTDTFGAMTFETDDGKIKGSVSGLKDADRKAYSLRREELIGQIISVKFNDLLDSDGNDYQSLSHPRFIELRDDKDESDTLERIIENRNMAMLLK